MTDMESVAEMLRLKLITEQRRSGRYLERLGQRFCVEFGYHNAVEKARAHWNELRRNRYALRKRHP